MKPSRSILIAILPILIILDGCNGCSSSLDSGLRKMVTMHYDHIANIQGPVFLSAPLNIPSASGFGWVQPADNNGFWAIFMICDLDVQGVDVKNFDYDIKKFYVEYDGVEYQGIPDLSVRYGVSSKVNSAAEGAEIAGGVHSAIGLGAFTKVFPHGLYPALNFRIVILIPNSPKGYNFEQSLVLKYRASETMSLLGNGTKRPDLLTDSRAKGPLPALCRPVE